MDFSDLRLLYCAKWAALCSVGSSVLCGLLCAKWATLKSGSCAQLFGLLCVQAARLYSEGCSVLSRQPCAQLVLPLSFKTVFTNNSRKRKRLDKSSLGGTVINGLGYAEWAPLHSVGCTVFSGLH